MIPKLEIFLNNRSTTIHRLLHILFTYDALFNWTIVKICILYTMISRAQTHFIFCYQPKNNGTELQRRTKLSRNDLGFQLTYRAALKTWKALGSSVSQLEAEMLPVDWSSWQRSQLFNLHSEAKKEERSSISPQKKKPAQAEASPRRSYDLESVRTASFSFSSHPNLTSQTLHFTSHLLLAPSSLNVIVGYL